MLGLGSSIVKPPTNILANFVNATIQGTNGFVFDGTGDFLEVADALTDILYVTYGAGHAFGIDLDKCFEEVQNSNMSKLGKDGKPLYNEVGKVMKGPNYFKPNLNKFIS